MSLDIAIKKTFKGFTLNTAFKTQGETMGILGTSGCGKTMSLKCIAGVETPDEGHIIVNDRVLFDSKRGINLKPQERKVGYLFQNYALFPRMTVRENLEAGTRKGTVDRGQKVLSIMEKFYLQGLKDCYPFQLSGGQQQRVALARLILNQPEVILLDEPFSALDTYLKEQLQQQLLELLTEYGKDVVLVTHNHDEVYKFCKNLMVMERGGSALIGRTKEMFSNPQLLSVARLLGCKNFSKIRALGGSKVEAIDWGLNLDVGREVPREITHIGIQGYDLLPWDGLGVNNFEIEVFEQVENLGEWTIIAGINGGEPKARLWWKTAKQGFKTIPPKLSIAPENILLLKKEG